MQHAACPPDGESNLRKRRTNIPVQAYFTQAQKLKLQQAAAMQDIPMSELLREIVDDYLRKLEKTYSTQNDDAVIRDSRRGEERIVKLIIKAMRGIAETRYMVYQQWVHGGPPPDGLTDEEQKDLLSKSKQRAYEWVMGK